ncbi:putative homogentisate phytyltransferase [Helianthus annuus]|nr:putative homogentisate phytyltransferase [Helianthus annuus]
MKSLILGSFSFVQGFFLFSPSPLSSSSLVSSGIEHSFSFTPCSSKAFRFFSIVLHWCFGGSSTLESSKHIFAIVAAFFMNIYIVGLNQLSDIEIDKVNDLRKINLLRNLHHHHHHHHHGFGENSLVLLKYNDNIGRKDMDTTFIHRISMHTLHL